MTIPADTRGGRGAVVFPATPGTPATHREPATHPPQVLNPPAHQSPSVKPQTLDPQLSLQQLQVQGAGRMVNHYTPFRVAHLLNVGWLADEGC